MVRLADDHKQANLTSVTEVGPRVTHCLYPTTGVYPETTSRIQHPHSDRMSECTSLEIKFHYCLRE